MIRRDKKQGWTLIGQHDHAELAGEIMRHWENGKFAGPKPCEEVLFAVREHDSGWKNWDASPKVNPESRYPMNFMEMDFPDQNEIWTRCFKKHSAEHPHASALIALHFARFNGNILRKNPCNAAAKNLRSEIHSFVSDALDVDPPICDLNKLPQNVRVNLRFVQIGDVISLALCHGWTEIEIEDVPLDYNGSVVTVELKSDDGVNYVINPYPFSVPLIRVSIIGRSLNQKEFSSDQELRERLGESRVERLEFTIRAK